MPNPGDTFADLVKKYEGCSLSCRRDELADLVCRGVDNPKQAVQIKTNCAMFTLGILKEAGVEHDLLNQPYKSGMAVAWVLQIARDLKALKKYSSSEMPKKGSILHYYTPGSNNNHVEWLLEDPDTKWCAEHGGGGRADNAITCGSGDIRWNAGRALREWIDPDLLLP